MKTYRTSRGHRRGRRIRRRGTLYVAVLGVTVIVSMLALSAMHVARLHLKSTLSDGNRHQARLLAASAIEHAIAEFNTNSNWQTDYALDTEYPTTPVSAAGGTFTWKLVDTGAANRRLDGIGQVGDTACTLSVDLRLPVSLDCGLLAGGDLVLWNFTESLTVNGAPVATNANLENWGEITADVNAQTTSPTGTINGMLTVGPSPRRLPNPQAVFNYYLANGTVIDPPGAGSGEIKETVLSPTSNPYGTPNADGIYIVDGSLGNLVIRDCRIVGTLIVTDLPTANLVRIQGAVNWEPAYPSFPALMVEGDLELKLSDDKLDESTLTVPNVNPTGNPFRGETDTDENDSYPSSIAGLVYCSGDMLFHGANQDSTPDIQGLIIVGGECKLQYKVNPVIDYDATLATLRPPGFGSANPPSAEQQWLDQNTSNSGDGSNYTLGTSLGVGTYFAPPSLPAEATSWAVTRIQLYCNDGGSTGSFDAQVTKADGSLKPAQVVESVTVSETSLPGTFSWHEITFANATGLSPSEGACLVFVDNSNAGARLKCGVNSLGSPDTHRLTTTDGGGSWTIEADSDMWIKIWGTYMIGGNEVAIVPGSWRQTPAP